jgi:hypothetical protein
MSATTTTTSDNQAIAYIIRLRSPHLSPRQLATAVRAEDRRDTFGGKRYERTHRMAWSPAIADSVTAPCELDQVDNAPMAARLVELMAAAGLVDLVDQLKAGRSIRDACQLAGLANSTACDRIASIRAQLMRELASECE